MTILAVIITIVGAACMAAIVTEVVRRAFAAGLTDADRRAADWGELPPAEESPEAIAVARAARDLAANYGNAATAEVLTAVAAAYAEAE